MAFLVTFLRRIWRVPVSLVERLRRLCSKYLVPSNYPTIAFAVWVLSWAWAFRCLSGLFFDVVFVAPVFYFPYLSYLYFLSVNRRLALILALSRAAMIFLLLGVIYFYLF